MKFLTQAVLGVASLQAVACMRADVTLPSEDSGTTGEEETTGEMSSESTAVEGECGDGVVDEGEGCDDGNKEDGDGCPSGSGGCVAAAVCGDGILWSGKEACDDGNGVAGDGCEEDCTETVEAECGNGVMERGGGVRRREWRG
jgi:cysteine-rich repeat protein